MNIKQSTLLIFALLLGGSNIFAQTETKEKTAKKVVIVKKTMDDNGNETVEKTILEGEEAANFDLESIDLGEGKKKIIRIEKDEEVEGEEQVKKQVRIMRFDSDEDELTPEMIAKLKKEGIDIEKIMAEAKGEEKKMKWVTEDEEVIEIDGEDKMVFINSGDDEVEIEKEIIIVDKDGKEKKTEMHLVRKKMGSASGNTLDIKSLNINVDGNTLTVNAKTTAATTSVRLMDTEGKMIHKEDLKKFDGSLDRVFNLEKAAVGPVFLVIKQGDKVFSERIVR
jgi:hypothetical protein